MAVSRMGVCGSMYKPAHQPVGILPSIGQLPKCKLLTSNILVRDKESRNRSTQVFKEKRFA
jgi:hypothetical protein